MVIKIISKTKTSYFYFENVAMTIDEEKKTVSLGNNTFKIRAGNIAYVINLNGATVAIVRG